MGNCVCANINTLQNTRKNTMYAQTKFKLKTKNHGDNRHPESKEVLPAIAVI